MPAAQKIAVAVVTLLLLMQQVVASKVTGVAAGVYFQSILVYMATFIGLSAAGGWLLWSGYTTVTTAM